MIRINKTKLLICSSTITIIICIFIIILLLNLIPVKKTIVLTEDIKNELSNTELTTLIAHHTQVTGGDWEIKEYITEPIRGVSSDIIIIGNIPNIDYNRFPQGLAGNADFIFTGKFVDEIDNGIRISVFLSSDWEIVYPYIKNGMQKKYLNIFDYMELIK